jgi:fructose-1-phosphate kinase PfkB-like protein
MIGAPHIFTLTGNLLAERTFDYATWAPGKTQRATRESFQVGGKGINVSKMLNRLGATNTALYFADGATGAECEEWLGQRKFSHRSFRSGQSTRVGTVVRSPTLPETTFLGPDAEPSAGAVAACAEFLDQQEDGQILACCGSFPGWASPAFDPLRKALERWLNRGVLAVDTYGPPLLWAAEHAVALIKINATEFRSLAGAEASFTTTTTEALSRWPVLRWVVTDGPNAVAFRDGRDAEATTIQPPTVREISPTGSGDVLFAAVLHSLFVRRESLRKALERALPLAAANAAHPGVAEFSET